jgi:POT family proton-dependent oligopeptide transporter
MTPSDLANGLPEFFEDLRRSGYRVDLRQVVLAERLLFALAERGELPEDIRELGPILGPLVCSTPEEQEEFPARYARWLGSVDAKPPPPPPPPAPRRSPWVTLGWLLPAAVIIASLVMLALPFGNLFLSSAYRAFRPFAGIFGVTLPERTEGGGFAWALGLGMVAAAWALAGLLWSRLSRRGSEATPEYRLAPSEGPWPPLERLKRRWDELPELTRAARALRSPQREPSPEIDPEATAEATAGRGGVFTPRPLIRRAEPVYLVLIDRVAAGDAQAMLYREQVRALGRQGLEVEVYYFDRDPRYCYRTPSLGGPVGLGRLAERHAGRRLLLFSDGAGLVDPLTGEALPWLRAFEPWEDAALLTPVAATDWGRPERSLSSRGWLVMPATAAGLEALADAWSLGTTASPPSGPTPAGAPDLLRDRPSRWIEAVPPAPGQADTVVMELIRFLGPDGLDWLAAVALLDRPSWDAVVGLGFRLTGSDGRTLADERRLACLAQLPWLRAGVIPEWLRHRLVARLTPEQLLQVRSALEDLSGSPPAEAPVGLSADGPGAFARALVQVDNLLLGAINAARRLVDLLAFIGRIFRWAFDRAVEESPTVPPSVRRPAGTAGNPTRRTGRDKPISRGDGSQSVPNKPPGPAKPQLPAAGRGRHPVGLYVLFGAEMLERFSYYGMRALLVLYLIRYLEFPRADALDVYAIYSGLVYLTPVLGGYLADKYLGQRKAILIGGILMALGYFAMAFEPLLYPALGLIILGNGFFKPNISTMVGQLYLQGDARRDSAYTIFYMGINLGAFFSPLVCGTLGERWGWHYGFGAAGVGMVLGVLIFALFQRHLDRKDYSPGRDPGQAPGLTATDWIHVVLLSLIGTGLVWLALAPRTFVLRVASSGPIKLTFLGYWLVLAIAFAFVTQLVTGAVRAKAGPEESDGAGLANREVDAPVAPAEKDEVPRAPFTSVQWQRIFVILTVSVFSILFWMGFEQAGGTLILFADKKTDRVLFGSEFPASWYQAVNPLLVIAIAPLFSVFWQALDRTRLGINSAAKMGLGLILLGIGMVVMYFTDRGASESAKVGPQWLAIVYLMFTLGELCLSPIGLSLVNKLAPVRVASLMMALWFFCTAVANYLAGEMEFFVGEEWLWTFLAAASIGPGILLLLLNPLLMKMGHGRL